MKHIGSGGMGDVVLAHDQDIGRQVALKKLHRDNRASVYRFAREIRSLGQLEHPGIVPIHDVGIDDEGRLFFVMKHLKGETLAEILKGLRERDPEIEARMVLQERYRICQALLAVMDFAHAGGIHASRSQAR